MQKKRNRDDLEKLKIAYRDAFNKVREISELKSKDLYSIFSEIHGLKSSTVEKMLYESKPPVNYRVIHEIYIFMNKLTGIENIPMSLRLLISEYHAIPVENAKKLKARIKL